MNEVKATIRRLKNSKAPGFDGIHNSLLKRLPHSGLVYVHTIVNSCVKLSYFPNSWKHAKVIALRKPGKDPSDRNNYRPISLLSKVLERMIANRIHNHLEDEEILPPYQEGYRRGRSTAHQLNRMVSHIKTGLANKQSTGLILANVQKAFDSVWHDGLTVKMIRFGFPPYIVKLTHSFLSQRSFQVVTNDKISPFHAVPFGVPEGSCLSPVLYNIYTADQPDIDPCYRALYADDTALFVSSSKRAEITIPLRNAYLTQLRYFRKWKISLKVTKTIAAFFTRRRTREIPRRPLRINNNNIQWSNDPVKYLGLMFDK